MKVLLCSVQVGQPRQIPDREPWVTAFYKEPVAGPVSLSRENLSGDRQPDLTVHGGPDKAVCVYSADHYPEWRRELGEQDCGPGWFGENFTVEGQTEETVCVGDVYRVGSAVVEVSQPRGPCWKLGRRWGRLDLPKLVVRSGRSGWYLRVLEGGDVAAGQVLALGDRPYPKWTIDMVNRLTYAGRRMRHQLRDDRKQLAGCGDRNKTHYKWRHRRVSSIRRPKYPKLTASASRPTTTHQCNALGLNSASSGANTIRRTATSRRNSPAISPRDFRFAKRSAISRRSSPRKTRPLARQRT